MGAITVDPLVKPAKTCAGRGAVKVTMASAPALSLELVAVCACIASASAPEGMSTATIGAEAAFILPTAAAYSGLIGGRKPVPRIASTITSAAKISAASDETRQVPS